MENLIYKYFNVTAEQREQIAALYALYKEWNDKINVISRKDIDLLYEHHVLHSLAILKFAENAGIELSGCNIMDVGTGGGFPGIPLAIMLPDSRFTLVDSVGKKIKVVEEIATSLGLENVKALNMRAEVVPNEFDYIVSRAVTDLQNFLPLVKGKYRRGIIYLKGGDLAFELDNALKKNKIPERNLFVKDISEWFEEEFFEQKKVIYIAKD